MFKIIKEENITMNCKIGGVTFNWKYEELFNGVKTLKEIGYDGFELVYNQKLLQDADRFRDICLKENITLAAMYYGSDFYLRDKNAGEISDVRNVVDCLSRIGGTYMIVGFGPRRTDRHGLTRDEYNIMAEILNEVGRICNHKGIVCCLHPHINQTIERSHEIRKLFDVVDTRLTKMCIDTGHVYAGGSDPAEIILEYRDIIKYVHMKDYIDGTYTILGRGEIDNDAILKALVDTGYEGWISPEVPAKTSGVTPEENAKLNYTFLADRIKQS
jgi:inosose dehydratase